jgi:hypothetical protein
MLDRPVLMKLYHENGEEYTEREALEKSRELVDLQVTLISLVKSPANRRPVVIKADGSWEMNGRILTKSEDKRRIYATVYEPETEDTQGDFARAFEIEKAAHGYIGAGRQNMVDYEHNYRPDYGTVVESYIQRSADPMFPGVKNGAWNVVILLSDEGASVIDEINGVSLAGSALRKGQQRTLGARIRNAATQVSAARPRIRRS